MSDHGSLVAQRYVPGEVLGRGAFGTVHRGVDRITGKPVAIKLLAENLRAEQLPFLRREVSALRMLRLPGVAHLKDEGEHEGRAFLVMDLVAGKPFPGRAGACTWESIRTPTLRLLESLARVHSFGVCHRDLKPMNVLVDEDGYPTILDFGLSGGSGIDPDLGGEGAGVGTPLYCAPEQLSGNPPDARSDLYSVGLMLYEALSGRVPHHEGDVIGLIRRRTSEPPVAIRELVPDLDAHVASVIMSMLQSDPENRPRSASDALESFRSLVSRDERSKSHHPTLAWLVSCLPDEGEAARLPDTLTEEQLRSLFDGTDRLFHLREDAARELWRRTEGEPERIVREVEGWVRGRLAHWSGARLAIERPAIERLRTGLHSHWPILAPPPQNSSETADETLSWMLMMGLPVDSSMLENVTERPREQLDEDLTELVSLGAVRKRWDDAYEPLALSGRSRSWTTEQRRRAHHRIAGSLAPGARGRFFHLVACGDTGAIVEEALLLAERLSDEGRLTEAEAILREALLAVRGHGPDVREELILEEMCKVALAAFHPQAFDRVRYEISRAWPGERVVQLEHLIRAAAAALETDGERALELADAIAPFEIPRLERWRQATRVLAAGSCSLEREEEVLAGLDGWAGDDRELQAAHAEWLGRLRYRQERFEEAAELHARAVRLNVRKTARLSAMLNGASALLEALLPDRAEGIAREAYALASACRHPYFEARAEWILRAAAYRRGEDIEPDLAFVEAVHEVGVIPLEAIVSLTEAAIAWRLGDNDLAQELALRSERHYSERGKKWQAMLASALSLCAGRRIPDDEVDAMAAALAECPFPLLSAQIHGLLVRSGCRSSAETDRYADAINRIPENRRGMRMEVLSVLEAPACSVGST